MLLEYQQHPKFDAGKTANLFESRGWFVHRVAYSNLDLVLPDPGASLECGDGRFGLILRKKHGIKLFGGINAIASLITGGDLQGFARAAVLAGYLDSTAGTHGAERKGKGCGLFHLWEEGKLVSAKYPLELLEQLSRINFNPTDWVKIWTKSWGGKHFTLPGDHQEEALVFNPFIGFTPLARTDRFSFDQWALSQLGVGQLRSSLFAAETVEKLSPVRTLELIV